MIHEADFSIAVSQIINDILRRGLQRGLRIRGFGLQAGRYIDGFDAQAKRTCRRRLRYRRGVCC
ncbi:hypothetical protein D3H35_14350 [Cohnella faecalis]|uniref:Uncharacterized protein n=1 Tax=Cohnella faecalis TaxID=2315694 RepID=A0A398CHN8_9BACL|nr:hypothetical protein D3H35_14350 [Cohnella faecalis]